MRKWRPPGSVGPRTICAGKDWCASPVWLSVLWCLGVVLVVCLGVKKHHEYFTFRTTDWFIGLVMVDIQNVCYNVTPESPILNIREYNKNYITGGGGCMKSVGQELKIGKNVPGWRDTKHFSCNFQGCCVDWSWNVLPTNRRDVTKGLRREEERKRARVWGGRKRGRVWEGRKGGRVWEGRKGGRVWEDKWREKSSEFSVL